VFALFDVALQIPALVLVVRHPLTKFSIAGASLSLVAALGLLTLVAVEHTKTIRPSTLTSLYLVTAILAHGVQLRTFIIRSWTSPIVFDIGRLLLASLVCKTSLLILESWPKQRILKLEPEYSPEEKSGFLGRVVYWWLIPLFWRGYSGILTQEELFPLDSKLNSQRLGHQMMDCWERSESSYY
jgi:ATP-binding cassette, subfamily C (CFTR/MRP), member 1